MAAHPALVELPFARGDGTNLVGPRDVRLSLPKRDRVDALWAALQ